MCVRRLARDWGFELSLPKSELGAILPGASGLVTTEVELAMSESTLVQKAAYEAAEGEVHPDLRKWYMEGATYAMEFLFAQVDRDMRALARSEDKRSPHQSA